MSLLQNDKERFGSCYSNEYFKIMELIKNVKMHHPKGYFHRNTHLLKILFIHFNQFHVYIGHKK